MTTKRQILDPLGTMCKLVSLIFYEIKTKISIQNHIIHICKPDKYHYQSVTRFINGDGKENISELYYVIIRLIKWYILPSEEPEYEEMNYIEISKSDEFKRLIKYMCEALRKLQYTYESGNVVLSLQFLINIVEEALIGKNIDNKLPKCLCTKDTEYETLIDYEKMKNLWEIKTLKDICELYDKCYELEAEDLPVKNKQTLIENYLRAINSILEITDNKFQNLVINSNSG